MLSRANRIRMFFKETPAMAITAFVLGVISVVIFLVCAVMSMAGKGNAGMVIGILGVLAMIFNVIGFAMATRATKGEDTLRYGMSLTALVLNGVMFVIYMIFYVFGFMVTI